MKKKILLVDDEETLRWALQNTLLDDGYDVEDTNDSVEALEMAKKRRYDLVISDLTMPAMNGVQLIAEIKKANPSTRAIIMTGYGSTEAVIEAMHTGVSDFITKPFKLEHMKKVIRKVLSESENTGTNAYSEKNHRNEEPLPCEVYTDKHKDSSCYIVQDETENANRAFYDAVETDDCLLALFGSFSREAGLENLDTVIKTVFRYEAKTCRSPASLIENMNTFLCEHIKNRFPLMLFCVILEKQGQKLFYSICGEGLTCFMFSQEKEMIHLQSYPLFLNMFPDISVPEQTLPMPAGNRFIVIDSNAVATGIRKGIIQKERLRDILVREAAGDCGHVAKKMKEGIDGWHELAADARNCSIAAFTLENGRGRPWKEEISISLPIDDYDEVLQLFEEKLSKIVGDECKRHDIITSVNEAVLNALFFAYKEGEKGEIVLKFSRLGEEIIIVVSDRGCGFDTQNYEEPDTTFYKGITKKDGRGIFIMKQLMDRVMIQSGRGTGTSVFLAKRVNFYGN
ncbi:response regulator [Candidatus Kuenenia sp.]|uniref:response regulator n=1 Tax=Candidatus Kuenenia sp. TaxID=2499824 RepID=UPI00321FADC6